VLRVVKKAACEWRRFWSVAKPWPDGSGWYDPQAMTPALFKWLNNSSNN